MHVVVPALLLLFMFSLTSLDLASPCKYQIFKIIFKAMANFNSSCACVEFYLQHFRKRHAFPSFFLSLEKSRQEVEEIFYLLFLTLFVSYISYNKTRQQKWYFSNDPAYFESMNLVLNKYVNILYYSNTLFYISSR